MLMRDQTHPPLLSSTPLLQCGRDHIFQRDQRDQARLHVLQRLHARRVVRFAWPRLVLGTVNGNGTFPVAILRPNNNSHGTPATIFRTVWRSSRLMAMSASLRCTLRATMWRRTPGGTSYGDKRFSGIRGDTD